MTTKYYGRGDVISYTAGSAGIDADDVVVVRTGATGMIGVALDDIAATEAGPVQIEGVFTLPKATGSVNAMAVGDIVYWDVADGNCQKVASANVKAGICVVAAVAAATTVQVKLIPSKA